MPTLLLALIACGDVGPSAGEALPDELIARVHLYGGTYTVRGEEHVWTSFHVRLRSPDGATDFQETAYPRVEMSCGETDLRDGALQSFSCWEDGAGWDVDLVRRDGALSIVAVPVGQAGPTGPEATWLAVDMPDDTQVEVEPVWKAPYAWADVRPEGDELVLRVLSGDPPVEQGVARVPVTAPCAKVGVPDPQAIEAWSCASGVYYVRGDLFTVGITTAENVRLVGVELPMGARTDW